MTKLQKAAAGVFLLLALLSLLGARGDSASAQNREAIAVSPSAKFPLGTDDLGRDRLARLIEGTRGSTLRAPAAAPPSTLLAAGASRIDTRVPSIRRASRSRPRSSVPKGNFAEGLTAIASRFCAEAESPRAPNSGRRARSRKTPAAAFCSLVMAAPDVAHSFWQRTAPGRPRWWPLPSSP